MRVMNPDVRSCTVNLQAIEKFRQVRDLALARKEFHPPRNCIQMYVGKSQWPHFRPHFSQSNCRPRNTSESPDKSKKFIYGEIRAAVDEQVGRMLKQLKEAIDHRLKGLNSDGSREFQSRSTSQFCWLDVEPVMVRPHDAKFEIPAIRCPKIAVGQGPLQERSIL